MDRSWGYNPASFFAPESSYGSPAELRHFVDAAHRHGLAVIFDVVYNHFGDADNVLWHFDGDTDDGGIYVEGGQMTDWGRGPGVVEARGAGLLPPERPDVPRGVPRRRAAVRRHHPDQRRAPAQSSSPGCAPSSPTGTSSPSTCPTTRGSRRGPVRRHLVRRRPPRDASARWPARTRSTRSTASSAGTATTTLEPGEVHARLARRHRRPAERRRRGRADQLGPAAPLPGRPARRPRRLDGARQVPAGLGAERRDARHADAVHGHRVPAGRAARRLGLLARRLGQQRRPPLRLDHRRRRRSACQMRRLVGAANAVALGRIPRCGPTRSPSPTRTATTRCSASSGSRRQRRPGRGQPRRPELRRPRLRRADRRPGGPVDPGAVHARTPPSAAGTAPATPSTSRGPSRTGRSTSTCRSGVC